MFVINKSSIASLEVIIATKCFGYNKSNLKLYVFYIVSSSKNFKSEPTLSNQMTKCCKQKLSWDDSNIGWHVTCYAGLILRQMSLMYDPLTVFSWVYQIIILFYNSSSKWKFFFFKSNNSLHICYSFCSMNGALPLTPVRFYARHSQAIFRYRPQIYFILCGGHCFSYNFPLGLNHTS